MTPSVALAILLVLAVLWAVSAQAACSSMRRGTALRDDALEDLQLRYSRLQAQHDATDRRFGNKKWLPVWASPNYNGVGYTMTRDEASDLYHEMRHYHPDVNYRIMECR